MASHTEEGRLQFMVCELDAHLAGDRYISDYAHGKPVKSKGEQQRNRSCTKSVWYSCVYILICANQSAQAANAD